MLVLDASVTLAWGLPDEQSEYADAALTHVAAHGSRVPSIWVLEVLNGSLMAERAKRFSFDDAQDFLHQLRRLHRRRLILVSSVAPTEAFADVAVLAREHKLTAYDAAYLHVAKVGRLPLATIDTGLAAVARKLGITVWTPEAP